MVFGGIVSSPRGSLSPQQALELANIYLENACSTSDSDIALVLCHDAEVSLSQAKKSARQSADNQTVMDGIATAYVGLGKHLEARGHGSEAQASYKKAVKLGGNIQDLGRTTKASRFSAIVQSLKGTFHSPPGSQTDGSACPSPLSKHRIHHEIATIPTHIFARNPTLSPIEFNLPEMDERLASTPQLVYCLTLLKSCHPLDDTINPVVYNWLQAIEKDTGEQDRLKTLATEMARTFKREGSKDDKTITEVAYLAPVLDKDVFQDLFQGLYMTINHSDSLSFHQLEGLARMIQDADSGNISADHLLQVLEILGRRARDIHRQSGQQTYQVTLAISHILDAIADTKLTDSDRERLHESLSLYIDQLKESPDPYLVYQAATNLQALLCVSENEKAWQAATQHTQKGSGAIKATRTLDLSKFMGRIECIQKEMMSLSNTDLASYDGVVNLAEIGQESPESLRNSPSFERKCGWYSALRGADVFIQNGDLGSFKKLVCEAPCRLDMAFQWGLCQRLGEIAADPKWDAETRRSAIALLGEIYRNDDVWGQHTSVKQWILGILIQLASVSGTGLQLHATAAETLLRALETSEDGKKQALYRLCREKGPVSYPLHVTRPDPASPSLLDRVQNRPDVEGNLRLLKKRRTKARGDANAVYVPPQAKGSLQAADDARFPLMEKVKEFLDSHRKVFLLLGDSGAGKSTFNRELEFSLWQMYKSRTGQIPLYIDLATIDKPEHDMIAKQLRRDEFTDAQIREMKHHRKFILICDGYDESQPIYNLYTSNRLGQPGEWDARMVISCRSENIGVDYRDRFQPGDHRQRQPGSSFFQEAVMAPFSIHQIHAYIKQYVSVHQPLWQAADYKQALELIPNMKDLAKNPYLLNLSMQVLPYTTSPGQHLSSSDRITRSTLHDQFIEQWLERSKRQLEDRDLSSQARATLDQLSDEGFTQHVTRFLKKLAVAIYKKQGGHPIVQYTQAKDERSWKAEFFNQEDQCQLLREACPLSRDGNQYRWMHRLVLEYALARAVFDPQDWREQTTVYESSPTSLACRRGSQSSILSFEVFHTTEGEQQEEPARFEPDPNSPLVWRSLVNDHSLLHFLEERVQQEPVFKQQLLAYIELSKADEKWRIAAANAITILVRAGVQFIGADLQGIQIPGADLSHGMFDSAQLQDADLRKTNLRGVWMRQTDLSRAQMTGVHFGELPFLTEDDKVRSCAYSPDGKTFAVGLFDGNIHVYSTLAWEKILTLGGHNNVVRRVVYSPKGDQLASSSQDNTVRLWDVVTGECRQILTGHGGWVQCVAYSPRGDRVASASNDKTVRIWDVASGECLQTLFGHTGGVISVVYSPNGQQIASGSMDYAIRLWNVETGNCRHILSGHSNGILEVAYSPRGDQLVSASDDKTIRLWNVESGSCRHVLAGHSSNVLSVAYSPNSEQVASGSSDGTVRLWDVETGTCRHTLAGHSDSVTTVVFSPNGNQVASGGFDKTVRLWDVSVKAFRFDSSSHSMSVLSVKCSSKGDHIITGSMDRTIRLWDQKSGACRQTLWGHTATVFGIACSPLGDQFASGSGDKSVRIWDVETGTCRHVLTGHSKWVSGVVYSPQGQLVVSVSDDKTVRLWDSATGDCRGTLHGHTDGILSVAYSPNGKRIASGSKDCTVRLWDVGTAACRHTLKGHGGWIWDVTYSPQGGRLASASDDRTVRIWDMGTGECRLTLSGHSRGVTTVAYSVKGNLLASGSWDKTVRLWNVKSGQCQSTIQNFQDPIRSVAWRATPDADYLVAGGVDGSVLMWQVNQVATDMCRLRLCWSATNGGLVVTGASVQDAHGLTQLNKRLWKQRGAIGEPEHLLHGTNKKLVTKG